ncbi:DUF3478 domain-containing protein [Shewanella sp. NFH-SH190041]|uniref:STAS/SEC14 domain-containing protein n=1 Tax=Shewanella sp. NFH-SH190041 TaxID=2950245 RepID=UPI0021C35CD8|nr:STAS/SEC14 domain-containing protein [Shewanella sp. NFH-SH190041]BDM63068.1 DUF3478 domain-containing protein [Shewanella sp. NFH-SH190041]
MLCQIPDITPGVISLFVSGRISALDYSECLQPLLRRYRDEFGRVKIYIEADVLLEGWETILLPDAGEVQLPQADALVFVGGPDWVGNAVQLLGPFVRGDIAWYPLEHKAQAQEWLVRR